jgi:hypothetical protein
MACLPPCVRGLEVRRLIATPEPMRAFCTSLASYKDVTSADHELLDTQDNRYLAYKLERYDLD